VQVVADPALLATPSSPATIALRARLAAREGIHHPKEPYLLSLPNIFHGDRGLKPRTT
jgi:hypothetical protein